MSMTPLHMMFMPFDAGENTVGLTLSSTSEVGRSWGIFCSEESTKLRKESDLWGNHR